ncbi:MAG: ribonuclease P protein component [Muribaculaceae bacterium]|nr:ribonuclease P protein component [Muribaculaceae bacterium]
MSHRLYKKEKLVGDIAIASLFNAHDDSDVHSMLAFPIKAIWRINTRRLNDAPVRFLISVPKRRIRHAVDRVTIRRRIREAYRLSRPFPPPVAGAQRPTSPPIDLILIYVAATPLPFPRLQRAITKILSQALNN